MSGSQYPTYGYRGETPAPPELHEIFDDVLDMDRVRELCRIGQADRCCIFLVASPRGFECAKGSSLEAVLLARRDAGTMVARGDNCDGPPTFAPKAGAL